MTHVLAYSHIQTHMYREKEWSPVMSLKPSEKKKTNWCHLDVRGGLIDLLSWLTFLSWLTWVSSFLVLYTDLQAAVGRFVIQVWFIRLIFCVLFQVQQFVWNPNIDPVSRMSEVNTELICTSWRPKCLSQAKRCALSGFKGISWIFIEALPFFFFPQLYLVWFSGYQLLTSFIPSVFNTDFVALFAGGLFSLLFAVFFANIQ